MAASGLKVGLMVPANNTTMEPELLAWLPGGSTCRTLRIPRGAGLLGPAEIPAYVARALELAKRYDPAQTDIVVYGCTAARRPVSLAGPRATPPSSMSLPRSPASRL